MGDYERSRKIETAVLKELRMIWAASVWRCDLVVQYSRTPVSRAYWTIGPHLVTIP